MKEFNNDNCTTNRTMKKLWFKGFRYRDDKNEKLIDLFYYIKYLEIQLV